MNIVLSEPNVVIPALKYGGAERILWDLARFLVSKKHKITFLVKDGSTCDFADVITYNSSLSIDEQIPEDTDLVHFHGEFRETNKKYIVTLHGHVSEQTVLPKNTVFISQRHAEIYGSKVFVYNGLNWDNYPKIELNRSRNQFHFLGKSWWKVKNLNGAINTALAANEKLDVLGGNRWAYKNLKNNTLNKLNPKIKYHGMVDNDYKSNITSQSKGMIFPVLWEEPFGLALIESLYFGAPVFGTPYGSLPELIIPEVGFLSNKMEDVVRAIKEQSFSPEKCRAYVLDNFTESIMGNGYLNIYEKVLNGEIINSSNPKKIDLSKNIYSYT